MGTLINAKLFGATPEAVKHYAIVFEDKVTDYDDLMSVHKDTPLNESIAALVSPSKCLVKSPT